MNKGHLTHLNKELREVLNEGTVDDVSNFIISVYGSGVKKGIRLVNRKNKGKANDEATN